jgi:DNA primase
MIPIRDLSGRVVGFGARTLEKDGIPKYLNSPQTTLFDKSRLLYGLDTAKRHIRQARQVVIVEGYMDVLQARQAGFGNVVAQMGTALTEEQLRLLKRYTKRFVLALDADAAGAKATMRSLEVARETLDRETEVHFNAYGLVRHEGRLRADIRVVPLPEGYDPDKIIRQDPERWPKLLAQAKPVVAYVIDVATRDLNLNDAKAKTAVARQVLPLIKDIVDPVERDHYWQQLARALQVDERALRRVRLPQKKKRVTTESSTLPSELEVKSLDQRGDKPLPQKAVAGVGSTSTEMRKSNYLSQCLNYPQVMIQVNEKLARNEQAIVSEADFTAAEDKLLLRQMYQRINSGNIVTIEELCDSLEGSLLERAHALLTLPPAPESKLERLADTLVLSVLDWRLEKFRNHNFELQQLFRDTQKQQKPELVEMVGQQIHESRLAIQRINKARDAMSAVNRRRAEERTKSLY